MECPRGWILATNSDGFIVPFFLKVRSVDVFYSSAMNDKFFDSTAIDPSKITDGEFMIIPPGQSYIFNMDGWRVMLNNNEHVIMTKDFAVNPSSYVEDPSNEKLTLSVLLPFKILYDDIKDIRITKKCSDKSLILSHQNIIYGQVSDDRDISSFKVDIYQHDGSTFPPDCLNNPTFQESIFQVTVEGFLQLWNYSHQDDGTQIGAEWDGSSGGVLAKDVYTKEEVQTIINNLRSDIKSGKVITPEDIIDVAEDPATSAVLNNGFILDIEEEQSSQNSLSEEEELSMLSDNEDILQIDVNDIFGSTNFSINNKTDK